MDSETKLVGVIKVELSTGETVIYRLLFMFQSRLTIGAIFFIRHCRKERVPPTFHQHSTHSVTLLGMHHSQRHLRRFLVLRRYTTTGRASRPGRPLIKHKINIEEKDMQRAEYQSHLEVTSQR